MARSSRRSRFDRLLGDASRSGAKSKMFAIGHGATWTKGMSRCISKSIDWKKTRWFFITQLKHIIWIISPRRGLIQHVRNQHPPKHSAQLGNLSNNTSTNTGCLRLLSLLVWSKTSHIFLTKWKIYGKLGDSCRPAYSVFQLELGEWFGNPAMRP